MLTPFHRLLACLILALLPFPVLAGTVAPLEKSPGACPSKGHASARCGKSTAPKQDLSGLLPNAVRSLPKIFRTA